MPYALCTYNKPLLIVLNNFHSTFLRPSYVPIGRVANFQTLVWDIRLFVIPPTLLLLFYIWLNPRLFGTFNRKTTTKHPKIQEFRIYFAKKFCGLRQKREKCSHPADSSCAWAGLWPAVTHTLSASRSFQTFLEHNVGNPSYKLVSYLFKI